MGAVKVNIKDLEHMKFSPGNIFWEKQNGSLVKVLHAGRFINFEKVSRFKNIQIDYVVDHLKIREIEEFFNELKDMQNPKKREALRKSFCSFIFENYFQNEKGSSLFDLIVAVSNSFFCFDDELIREIEEKCDDLFYRSLLIAGLTVVLIPFFGGLEYKFLADVFKITILKDAHLNAITLSSDQLNEFETLRVENKSVVSEDVLNFPLKSFEKLSLEIKKDLSYPHLLKILKKTHEKFDGTGFPNGLKTEDLNDVEMLWVFLNSNISYGNVSFEDIDAKGFLNKLLEEMNRYPKISKRIFNNLAKTESKNKMTYLKIEGL